MSEYEDYLQDQREDTILEPQYHDEGKSWLYKYCDYLVATVQDLDYKTFEGIDIGCREFFTYDYFLEKFSNSRLEGVDICNLGIDYAYQYDKPVLDLDAHELMTVYEKESQDLVMSFHALEHMYDMNKVLKNCYDVLRTGGYFYFAVPVPCKNERRGHWADISSVEFMEKLCTDLGFVKVTSQFSETGVFRNEAELVAIFRKE